MSYRPTSFYGSSCNKLAFPTGTLIWRIVDYAGGQLLGVLRGLGGMIQPQPWELYVLLHLNSWLEVSHFKFRHSVRPLTLSSGLKFKTSQECKLQGLQVLIRGRSI